MIKPWYNIKSYRKVKENQEKKRKVLDLLSTYINQLRNENKTIERIIQWSEYAKKETIDVFKRFIFRWISFNGLYSAIYAFSQGPNGQEKADSTGDLDKINFFCNTFILSNGNIASRVYSKDLKDVFLNYIKKREDKHIEENLKVLNSSAPVGHKTKSIIIVAYKIRCRLFHGEKNPNLYVNRKLVKAADKVIDSLMEYINIFST
ncbi:MAG: hypothetical protein GF311_18890 [Candidatus Lokiarchaeota archaeon]|nr:hypothetical protein [Candidatus Lokiarchaeota archaeon]